MAEPTQFMFSHQEIVAALLKQQGIHTGKWTMAVEFAFGVGSAGPTPTEAMPTAMISVVRIGLQQSTDPNGISFDAAELNPVAAPAKAKRRPPIQG